MAWETDEMPELLPSKTFEPIRTARLLLRPVRLSDSGPLVARRNDPEVASYQDWPMPYSATAAERATRALAATTGPTINDWWALTVADAEDTVVLGDLALKLESGGHAAIVGYTFARKHWGEGYATEALRGLLDWLLDENGVMRVGATIHPDNLRSAKVLERCGFEFEGQIKNTYWDAGTYVDDWSYGLTPATREVWNNRPTHRPDIVELVEPHPVGLRQVLELQPHQSQDHFVAPIAASLSQVAVPPFVDGYGDNPDDPRVVPWPRIVHADGVPVGFVIMAQPTELEPDAYLWRLMVDRLHQGRSIGWQVLEHVSAQARAWGAPSVTVSWVPGYGSPAAMYERFGFVPTGEIDDGEIVARLPLIP